MGSYVLKMPFTEKDSEAMPPTKPRDRMREIAKPQILQWYLRDGEILLQEFPSLIPHTMRNLAFRDGRLQEWLNEFGFKERTQLAEENR